MFISELYVDGNMLECDGLVELIRLVVDQAEIDAAERQRIKEEEELLIRTAVSENDKPVYSKYIMPAKSDTRCRSILIVIVTFRIYKRTEYPNRRIFLTYFLSFCLENRQFLEGLFMQRKARRKRKRRVV